VLAAVIGCGLAATLVPSATTAQAGTGRATTIAPPVYTTTAGTLAAVTVISADDAWAVGAASAGSVLIVHWNGQAWTRFPAPVVRGYPSLNSVAGSSARNVWAVGNLGNAPGGTLILHFNGVRWSRVPSPYSSRGGAALTSVAVARSGAAWAVGIYKPGGGLILRWAGGRWRQQTLPSPDNPSLDGAEMLTGVAASSAKGAWAVGLGDPGYWTTFARWQGKDWRVAASPNVEGGVLAAIALAPHGQAWAVGRAGGAPLIMRYSGSSWRRVRIPALGKGIASLNSVTVLRDGTAWAAGSIGERALILYWNGRSWRSEPTPTFTIANAPGAVLSGVAAFSGGNAWAVGYPSSDYGFILAWNGAQW
jgi:hypothetical protein